MTDYTLKHFLTINGKETELKIGDKYSYEIVVYDDITEQTIIYSDWYIYDIKEPMIVIRQIKPKMRRYIYFMEMESIREL